MNEVLLMNYEKQLEELDVFITIYCDVRDEHIGYVDDEEYQLFEDEIKKMVISKEVLRRRIELLKVEIKTEEESA